MGRPRDQEMRWRLLEAIGAGGKTLLVLERDDETAGAAFRNLPQVCDLRSGQLTAYDVLWAEHVVFTRRPLGSVGGGESTTSPKSDFVGRR